MAPGCTKMATGMYFSPFLLFQNGKVASEESQNQQHLNINFDTMVDLIMRSLCLLGTLCFGKELQILRVGKNMTIEMRLIPYDARSILFHNRY